MTPPSAMSKSPLVRFSVAIGGELLKRFDRYREDHRYPNRSELFIDLTLGRLDAVLTDVIAGRVEFLETELGADYDFAGPALDDPAWFGRGTGIAVRKGDEELRGALDGALREVRADGTLDAIRSRYFGFSIE